MAVQEQTPYIEHIANGVTTSFALEFDCKDKEHLIVLVDNVEPNVGTWSLANGSVVFGTAPANGKIISIQRNTPFRRDTNFQSYDNSLRPATINKDFDWIWYKLQELGVADWILGNRIDALKNYVDRKDDELKAYLMEEIRKQGVALDQLDDYYNYLMQRLAQIAVDKGWDASFVVDASGLTQQEINNGFLLSEMLDIPKKLDGSMVYLKSRLPPNYALKNPFSGGGRFIYDSSKSNINDGGLVIDGWVRVWDGCTIHVDWFGADPTGNLDSTQAIKSAISSVSTRTTSPFIETKPTCTVEYGTGVYKQGDVPLVSCVEYRGQGSTITQIIPSYDAEYLFKTIGSSEGEVISPTTRLCYNTIVGMTLGYGYVQQIPMVNTSAGGVYQEASSWCKMRDVNFCGNGGIALRLVGVWDADFTNVTFFNNGHQTNSTTLLIEPVANSNDGSNAITFTRSHFEGNYRHFEIAKNSRHIYFNWAKIEAFTVPSSITDPQGIVFNSLEASTHDFNQPLIGHHSTSDYTPFIVEYNDPVFFGGGYYLYSDANYPVRINGGSSKEAGRIAYGKNFRISDHYGFFCGRTFLDLTDSIVSDCEFAYLQSGTADGTLNSVQLSGNSKLSNTIFSGTGNSTDGRAFVSAAPSIPIIDCTFESGSQYAIRGAPSNKHKNNTAVTTMYSSGGVGLSEIEGFSFGDKSSYKILATKDALASISCVNGSSLIQTRAENKLNALLYADSWSGLTLIGKTSTIDIVTTGSTGVSGDGKVYISNTGSTLNIMNRTNADIELYMLINSVIT